MHLRGGLPTPASDSVASSFRGGVSSASSCSTAASTGSRGGNSTSARPSYAKRPCRFQRLCRQYKALPCPAWTAPPSLSRRARYPCTKGRIRLTTVAIFSNAPFMAGTSTMCAHIPRSTESSCIRGIYANIGNAGTHEPYASIGSTCIRGIYVSIGHACLAGFSSATPASLTGHNWSDVGRCQTSSAWPLCASGQPTQQDGLR